MDAHGFLAAPPHDPLVQRLFDGDVEDVGYVMNASRMWAYQPETHDKLFDLMREATGPDGLSMRQRGILVSACASTYGDSYCALAWGSRLAAHSDEATAAGVLAGTEGGLTAPEAAMARWARTVARDPSGTGPADVQHLRDAGFDDATIFAITVYVALRLAFSTVNDALGARPDAAYRTTAPAAIRAAVTFGRPIEDEPAA